MWREELREERSGGNGCQGPTWGKNTYDDDDDETNNIFHYMNLLFVIQDSINMLTSNSLQRVKQLNKNKRADSAIQDSNITMLTCKSLEEEKQLNKNKWARSAIRKKLNKKASNLFM